MRVVTIHRKSRRLTREYTALIRLNAVNAPNILLDLAFNDKLFLHNFSRQIFNSIFSLI